jgi:formylglycine-generating enzyme
LETMVCDYTANGYRLPTEAEWEYACRAGSTTAYSFGDSDADLKEHGWYEVNSAKTPKPVGAKKPNAWGLYDMHGNVSEWCNDTYDDTFYGTSSKENPRNDAPGDERVLRGGNWDSDEGMCRSSARFSEVPGLADVCFGYDAYGFRCVRRVADGEATPQ